ncbi:MAG: RNA-binding S4 domain-containing protein [Gammaproteobacteria bacterium]|nr:RNA-binding S4 domain-containing protein [Gammaproteobacteria bacterium]MCP4879274.1 RNA-binding S4 domain-containing protein [Gammaproteobacteria bacterium]MDP6165089.1 RNA-binding S4 domain-containing protein [Gammaproteobacteria bacterium]
MHVIEINHEPVELHKILKFEGLVESGAQAKLVIADGLVHVNGEQETRKRRKMMNGDTIHFADQNFVLQLI